MRRCSPRRRRRRLGASLDPRTVGAVVVPDAEQILAKQPMSLTETVYDAQGRVSEVRDYDVAAVSPAAHGDAVVV